MDIPEVQGEGPTMRFNQIVHSAPTSIISCARRDAGCQFPDISEQTFGSISRGVVPAKRVLGKGGNAGSIAFPPRSLPLLVWDNW